MGKMQRRLNFLTAFFIPCVPMFFLYSNNATEINIIHVICVALALGAVSLLGYFAVSKALRSPFAGIVFCIACWVFFFAYGALRGAAPIRHLYLLLIVAAATAAATVLSARLGKKVGTSNVCSVITVMAAIMLVWNGIAAVAAMPKTNGDPLPYKTEFAVEEALPAPNVYWLHMDGMLGFDAVEKYYGDAQEEFAAALSERGFVINRGAKIETGHKTNVAVPALMNPESYDDYLFDGLLIQQEKSAKSPASYVGEIFNSTGMQEIRDNNETVKAFGQRGYYTAAYGNWRCVPPITDYFSEFSRGKNLPVMNTGQYSMEELKRIAHNHDQGKELRVLMDGISMTSAIPSLVDRLMGLMVYNKEAVIWRDFESSIEPIEYVPSASGKLRCTETNPLFVMDELLSGPSPRFAFVYCATTHCKFVLDEDGAEHKYERDYAQNYYPQHIFAAKCLVSYIDFILERDPDAVIVLQGDHGLHAMGPKNLMKDLSIEKEDVYDLWNCVMSAVRVPEGYGTIEEPLNPVNISRYLVNNFVGENYEYRRPEDSRGLY